MDEQQIIIELAEIEKDEYLTASKKRTYLSIYGAELERQRLNRFIAAQKVKIQNLRAKIIDDIINIYPNLDEKKKLIAGGMLYELGLAGDTVSPFRVNDYICEYNLGNLSQAVYLDDDIHKKLVELNNMHRLFLRCISRKNFKIAEKLSNVLDPEVFNFIDDKTGNYKEQEEFNDIFVKQNQKINKLAITSKEKNILRNILNETIKYGKSYGTMYEQFEDMTEYIDQRMKGILNNKKM